MNAWIEHLNHWGENALAFAWPMLWQSSLLILVVFALDCLLARRVRAAIRHALWMVVLVKLLLPPALALPTGAAWWLWPVKPSLTPVIKTETVTFDASALPENFVPQTVPIVPPPPKLSSAGWMMLASGAMSGGLLFSLLFQWLKVERKTRRAGSYATASSDFADALTQSQQLAGLRRPMRLQLVDDAMSPAVYGLFRPVILLPRALAEKLSATQLRAVLLHEAIHLRRGDVRVNCAQTLLQIVYWWHPILWLANARIRRLREEAVDDAVMVALRGDADAYAPTLLEVAKFAFRRPLASLGLVGILESRSALRQRVERLVDFRPPRHAGVTLLSLCGIFLFGAVALPMGQAPAATTDSVPANNQLPPPTPPSPRTEVYLEGHFYCMPSRYTGLLTDGLDYESGSAGEASVWKVGAGKWDEIKHRIQTIGAQPFSNPRIQTTSGTEAEMYVGNQTNWYKFDCTPVAADEHIGLAFQTEIASVSVPGKTNLMEFHGHAAMENKGSIILSAPISNDASSNLVLVISAKTIEPASGAPEDIHRKLNRIHLNVSYQAATLADVLSDLAKRSRQFDPEEEGISFIYSGSVPGRVEATERTAIHINLTLNDCSLGSILDAVCAASDYPIKYSVEEGAVVFAASGAPFAKNETIINATTGRKDIYHKLNQIHLDTVAYNYAPLSEVLRDLHEKSLLADPEKLGINFLYNPNIKAVPASAISAATGLPVKPAPAPPQVEAKINIPVTVNLTDVSLTDLLNTICLIADHPIKYSVEDYGVVFSPKDPDTAHYETRTFHLDTNKFGLEIEKRLPSLSNGTPPTHISVLAKEYFQDLGVNLEPPKTIYFNGTHGVLFVYATPQDLDVIEQALANMNVGMVKPSDTRRQAAALAKDGQQLYEMGRLGDASENFAWALALDPGNQEARYYVNLIDSKLGVREVDSARIIGYQSAVLPARATQVPFLLAKPRPNSDAFVDGVFDPLAFHPPYQPVSAPVNPSDLVTNYFRINMAAFNAAVRKETGESDELEGFKELAAAAGVNFSPPEYVAIMSERFGMLYVLVTKKDMNIIMGIIDGLHCVPPQIHIKARFIEVPKTFFDDERDSIPSNVTNGGVLTAAQFRKFLHQLQSQKGPQELAEPEVTTIQGRQTQMRATILQDVVTNFMFEAASPTQRLASITAQTTKVETGPILDVLAMNLPDGYTIDLKTIPAIVKFYGYADTQGLSPSYATNSDGQKIEVPISIPVFSVGEVTDEARLYDGQALVLLPKPEFGYNRYADEKYRDRIVKQIQEAQKKEGDKVLIVLVTVTLIDPVGNPIHSDADMAFAKNRVPQQPIVWDSN
jgi:beta-lactamase regulating signal transducer with metallopeptidase domain